MFSNTALGDLNIPKDKKKSRNRPVHTLKSLTQETRKLCNKFNEQN